MIPFLPLLRSRFAGYAIGILAAILVGGIQQVRINAALNKAAACESTLNKQVATYRQAQADGQEAARRAVEAAVQAERAEAARRIGQEREAAQRLSDVAKVAAREANEWRARYREAIATNPSCATWQAEKVKCPTD